MQLLKILKNTKLRNYFSKVKSGFINLVHLSIANEIKVLVIASGNLDDCSDASLSKKVSGASDIYPSCLVSKNLSLCVLTLFYY